MDSFTFNKIAGAVLGTILIGFVVIEVSHMLYPSPREYAHGATGYAVPGMEHGGHGDDHGEVVEEVVDIGTLLASADASAGASGFRACASCHANEAGAANGIGPNLWGVVNRAKGSVDGFRYSGAMQAAGGDWTFENLNSFIESPRNYLPGTSMGYAGMRNDSQRANLLAYLATLADSPVPLPSPAAAQDAASEMMDDAHGAAEDHAADMMEEAEVMADDAAADAMDGDAGEAMEHAEDAMADDMPADDMPAEDGGDE